MQVVWLPLGSTVSVLVVLFSAVFTKIERVRLTSKARKSEGNNKIGLMHVMHIIALMVAIEVVILSTWQSMSPLRWQRDVLLEENGIPVESVGKCSSVMCSH